jgi:hypothetical protein
MPFIYLDRTERDRQIADAIKRLQPCCELKETEQRIIVSDTSAIRISRQRLEEALGAPMPDDEWRQKFARSIGEVAEYTVRDYVLEDEPPGDY